ncbi:YndM family protein [Ectobacillus sp. sgz5001026]|uniref:YndM family protein n=1 Tax=Ectobacillus sp. sgz5001026 TaxID=3242473 RepID=UPI0036D31113
MKQTTFLLMKFLSSVVAFSLGLAIFFPATITEVLSFSMFVTIVSYVVVENILLPRIGNGPAAIVDFLITYMSVWIFGNVLLDSYLQMAWGSIISAVLVTVASLLLHRLSWRELLRSSRMKGTKFSPSYGTEFSEEKTIPEKKE